MLTGEAENCNVTFFSQEMKNVNSFKGHFALGMVRYIACCGEILDWCCLSLPHRSCAILHLICNILQNEADQLVKEDE